MNAVFESQEAKDAVVESLEKDPINAEHVEASISRKEESKA